MNLVLNVSKALEWGRKSICKSKSNEINPASPVKLQKANQMYSFEQFRIHGTSARAAYEAMISTFSRVCSNVPQMEGFKSNRQMERPLNRSNDSANYSIIRNWLGIWEHTLVTSRESRKVNVRVERKQLESETKIIQKLFQSTRELIMWPICHLDYVSHWQRKISTPNWVRAVSLN